MLTTPDDIGKRLYEMYEAGPVSQPVPEKFLELLVELETRDAEKRGPEKEEKKQDG